MGELVTVRCRAVLFDMDGTLVNSTQVVEAAWNSWAARHSLPLAEVLSFSHGRPTISTLEHFLPGQDHSEEEAELALFEETQTEGILAFPGAADIIHALRTQNHPWAVVTSAWRNSLKSVQRRGPGELRALPTHSGSQPSGCVAG